MLATGAAIGLLSSVIPYRFELEALRRIPPRVFGIWMSLEPAVAAVIGLVLLGEALARPGVDRGLPGDGGQRGRGARRGRRSPGTTGLSCPCRCGPSRLGVVLTDSASERAAASPSFRFSRASIARAPRTLADSVLAPSAASMRRIALAGVIASAGIILTGAAVRLSQSGLGCPDWPACTAHSIVAGGSTGSTLVHRWIEFGNRLVTGAILVIAVIVAIAGWRFRPGGSDRRRTDVVMLSLAQPPASSRRRCSAASWCSPSSTRSGSPCISCCPCRWSRSPWRCTSR